MYFEIKERGKGAMPFRSKGFLKVQQQKGSFLDFLNL
jgi:hypothetical protein